MRGLVYVLSSYTPSHYAPFGTATGRLDLLEHAKSELPRKDRDRLRQVPHASKQAAAVLW